VGHSLSAIYRSTRSFGGRVYRSLRRRAGVAKRRADATAQRLGARAAKTTDTLAWTAANFRGRNGLFRVETLLGTPGQNSVPVIVCLWNRPQRIDDILTQLDAQATRQRVRLMFWNNNNADDAYYRERIAAFTPSGALASVEYVQSRRNVGGIGRFFLAKHLFRSGFRNHFITLDDDQDVTPSFIDTIRSYAAPREFAGFWAWNYIDSHWNRTETPPGELADYAGTGGAICDIEIVRSSDFFTKLPRRFAFLEDQWLCGYAKSQGWSVRKADLDITFVLHETNQFPQLAELKNEFRQYLIDANAAP
jgi:hypothetical protein